MRIKGCWMARSAFQPESKNQIQVVGKNDMGMPTYCPILRLPLPPSLVKWLVLLLLPGWAWKRIQVPDYFTAFSSVFMGILLGW